MLVRKFPPKVQGLVDFVAGILSLCLFLVVSYEMFVYGRGLQASGEVSMTLELPVFWLVFFTALACLSLCPVFVWEIYQAFRKAVDK